MELGEDKEESHDDDLVLTLTPPVKLHCIKALEAPGQIGGGTCQPCRTYVDAQARALVQG